MKKIKYDGTQKSIFAIFDALFEVGTGKANCIRHYSDTITIPTQDGAKDVFVGDTIIFDKEKITIEEGKHV